MRKPYFRGRYDMDVQAAILSILVGLSFLVLVRLALRQADRGGGARRMRLTLGVAIGLLAAFAVLVTRTDLIPDGFERGLSVAVVVLAAGVSGFVAWYVRGA